MGLPGAGLLLSLLLATPPPNIVLIFPDNLGIGEIGVYGGNRGVPTPRLDALSREGMRLTNFNTEYFCTPSRAAILTGRHSVRSGTNGNHPVWGGLTQWEVTLAELLEPRGYARGLYGKWHLGNREGRYPTDQGFEEWYGIPLSSNEAQASTTGETPYIWEGKAGEVSRKVKVFDLTTRRTIDREAVGKGVDFMERHTKASKPFFLFLPLTQVHFPTLPHPDFAGKTGAGDVGDAMAEMDHNVGVILDAIKRLGIEKNTIVIWTTDGGAEFRRPWRGTSGPWRGFYTTAMEGGLRTPFMIRWPGRIPANQVSDEIVHEVDVFTTLARAAGLGAPGDRAIDGVDQLPFFEAKQARSKRDGFPVFMGTQVRAVKLKEWKLHYAWQDEPTLPAQPIMKLFNLRSDPKEETDIKDLNPWAESVLGKIVTDFNASLEKYPLIPLGAPDPYTPSGAPSGNPALNLRATEAPPNAIWLDTLDLATWQQRRQRPRARLSLRGKPITMDGIVYPRGVGTLTINEFLVDVKGEAQEFVALVGIDDEMKSGRGSVNFEVWADDKLVASSGVMRAGQPPKLLVADLKGARIVQLITDDGQDTSNDDHADWAGAMFVMKAGSSARPEPYVLPPDTPAVISRTKRLEPSINGPRITGATPGRPFLFRIPATGEGPLTFSARGLPKGVTLDPNTGIISGSLANSETTVVDLTVRGARGTATRKLTIVGGKDKLALTPPMGWNSWNAWGVDVDAEKVRSSADAMIKSGLAGHGFQYVAIDDGWEGTRTPDGELPADASKFPDMKALGDYIHSLGLKFGIYSSPGPTTCGGRVGSYQHELQDARTWARWGVDLLKHDYCSYERVKPGFEWSTLQAPYIVMRQALDAVDRDIVYSVGNYGYGESWKWAGEIGGELWRTTGDLTDSWSNLESVGFRQAGREQYAGPGRWNDTDMLVVGSVGLGPSLHPTRLTQNEQVLHITLWAMQAAPLLIGADMSQLDDFTIALLTNDEVIDVDQDVLGKAGGRVWKEEKLEVWSRPLSDGTTAVALFNRGMKPREVTARWSDIGVSGSTPVRDLWLRKELGAFTGSFKAMVPRHGAVMVKVGAPKTSS